ncbi:hypothetical protein OESDEN_01756 [Oesophagostomum dentatum]|uniref:Cuticlin C-terminal domain-containing protein n=1 Tax=Oesophagostomum dentatum TaxID=61180 RepID=A0A0B1TL42_OESDE|nr:hypothetical protein OESDEN_01756 [Oesophagostomum dentatum]
MLKIGKSVQTRAYSTAEEFQEATVGSGTEKGRDTHRKQALTTQVVEGQTQLPVCRYEILSDGPNGVPIKYGKIGETVYHKWTCVSELADVYCMRVHSCTVYDGQGGPPVTVLDANG